MPFLKAARGVVPYIFSGKFWFHMGLAVTMSNRRSWHLVLGEGWANASCRPSAISASMSCRKAFMRDMANVDGLISWPNSRSGATSFGSSECPLSLLPGSQAGEGGT